MLKKARELWTGKSPWGGYITSDSDSIDDVVHTHHYVNDSGMASCLGVRDGGDDYLDELQRAEEEDRRRPMYGFGDGWDSDVSCDHDRALWRQWAGDD